MDPQPGHCEPASAAASGLAGTSELPEPITDGGPLNAKCTLPPANELPLLLCMLCTLGGPRRLGAPLPAALAPRLAATRAESSSPSRARAMSGRICSLAGRGLGRV